MCRSNNCGGSFRSTRDAKEVGLLSPCRATATPKLSSVLLSRRQSKDEDWNERLPLFSRKLFSDPHNNIPKGADISTTGGTLRY